MSGARNDGQLLGVIRPRRPEDFDALYTVKPAWEIGRPQSAFLALAESGAIRGRVLDVGCGTGDHVLMAAEMGLNATGIDLAAAAIAVAETKARDRGLAARFLVRDALQLALFDEQFDTVLDCGLFHNLPDDSRRLFADSLRTAIRPDGRYFMLCFSDRQPGNWGPRRISHEEIRATFDQGWQVDVIEPTNMDIWIAPKEVHAWLACIKPSPSAPTS